jgi:hypothetical protein
LTAAEARADEFAKVTGLGIRRAHAILKTVRLARSVPNRTVINGDSRSLAGTTILALICDGPDRKKGN